MTATSSEIQAKHFYLYPGAGQKCAYCGSTDKATACPGPMVTEELLTEVLGEVRRLRRASLIDLVPFDEQQGWSPGNQPNRCTPETHVRKVHYWLALKELVQRGVLVTTVSQALIHYQEATQ